MQKTLEILEKNVQWIVLGLAALFLAWAAYAYVVTPPATVKIGTRVVTAADVSQATQVAAKDLDQQIKENKPVSFPTPDLVTDWQRHFTSPFTAALPVLCFTPLPDLQAGINGPGLDIQGPHITQLPVPPAPQLLAAEVGLSTVTPQPPNLPQGGGPGPAPAPPVVQPQPRDTVWVTLPAFIPARALSQSLLAPFNNAPLPPGLNQLYNTTLLQVVLERQQSDGVDANGAPIFAAGAAVKRVDPLIADQPYLQKMPDEGAPPDTEYSYIKWAQDNQALLATPAFYPVAKGDVWPPPQLPAPGAAPPAPGTVNPPAQPSPAPPASNTAPPAAAPTPNAAGMKYSAGASYAPVDPARPAGAFQFQPGQTNVPFVAAQPMNANNGNGIIDPFNLQNDILIWATDETATPGQTYRYRVKYVLKNPVFAVQGMAQQKLTNILAITSAPSSWSDPIKVPPMTKFWVAKVGREEASLDVFQYQGGDWKPIKSVVAPGDEVPGTDLTLVDVRPSEARGHDKYVLLTSNTGDMVRRDVTEDQNNPDHQAMLNPTNNPNGGNTPAPPGPVGPVGPRGQIRPTGARMPVGGH